jgi:uncharacterized cupin superfamily protein
MHSTVYEGRFPMPDDVRVGNWECEPGGWPVIDRPTTETCYILSGRATITDAGTGEIPTVRSR